MSEDCTETRRVAAMPTYKDLYLRLFSATEDALEQLEQNNFGLARDRLISAQREAEEAVVSAEIIPDE